VLLATLLYLPAMLSHQERGLAREIRTLVPMFEEVMRMLPAQAVPTLRALRLHRQNASYASVLSLCALILSHLSVANRAGRQPFASFLVDMPGLFETFLTVRLRSILPAYGLRVVAQRHDYLDEAGRVLIRPDILVYPRRGSTPLLVVDAKYRSLGTGTDHSADYYQVGAYMGRYGLERGALIYAHSPDMGQAAELLLRGTGKSLYILSLDLSSSTPAELEEECERLAQNIASLALKAGATLSPR
jgi:5-methylcytosine-specific restriction enzyme subunit McrC